MSLYQFLIAVRQGDGQQLMSESGETTSHLMGFFYRTLRMIDHGMKPMYVFDGKPPDLKKQVVSIETAMDVCTPVHTDVDPDHPSYLSARRSIWQTRGSSRGRGRREGRSRQ